MTCVLLIYFERDKITTALAEAGFGLYQHLRGCLILLKVIFEITYRIISGLVTDTDLSIRIRIFTADTGGYPQAF